eukprot:GFUD01038336.1.p1 GENE.GFUD01038336.1~~GFUD01038336.1.p1  ORF type:complete len:974 (+),score=218.88 GFUD01038336.1:74-2995(+)
MCWRMICYQHFIVWILLVINAPERSFSSSCGYESCPKPKDGMINVHFVPHTHNDVGWLKTVDQYYYGSRTDIQRAGVQYILDSVVDALLKDPERRFIYVESAFFWRWWGEQTEEKQKEVKNLVEEGRLEFIGGGWSMNDEAAAHYTAIIDNMSYGIKFFSDHFGKCGRPRVSWQIDPFGHSREQANIFAKMGFDGLFFGRLDYADKEKRMRDNTMEMIWKGDPDEKSSQSDLFTGALFHAYSPPPGFCFDSLCQDVLMDDPRMEDFNMDEKVAEFVKYTLFQASSYATDNLIMTMGEDFNYMNANMWFKNMDKLKNFLNTNQDKHKINVMYSTPSCYLKSLHSSNKTWTVKSDDFFPYASDPHAYWTGYFTSRPALKGMIRQANSLLQACKQIHSRHGTIGDKGLETAKRSVAVNQHHDAVTGTAKQHVTDDYALRLHNGMTACRKVMADGLNNELGMGCSFDEYCPMLNISQCAFTEQRLAFSILVYNPLANNVSSFIRIPVKNKHVYRVLNHENYEVETQLVPLPDQVLKIPGRLSSAKYELVFFADDIPGLGSKLYKFEHVSNEEINLEVERIEDTVILGNSHLKMEVNKKGILKRIKTKTSDIHLIQEFAYYKGAVGDNSEFVKRASGAYIFRPKGNIAIPVGKPQSATVIKGNLVQEVHQQFNDWTSQVIRLYRGHKHLELEWIIGPLPSSQHETPGLEVISRYRTDIDSGDLFKTDSNGRFMIQRQRNHRPTWDLNLTEPVSANYYPVVSRMSIEDSNSVSKQKKQVWIMTDRAEGGTSLQSGEMELMLHRRLFNDDGFGVGEALNETAYGKGLVVRGKHKLLLCEEDCEIASRRIAEEELMKPVIFFGEYCSNLRESTTSVELPADIKLLTMEKWSEESVLVRLENIKIDGDPTKVDLDTLFPGRTIANTVETTLDGSLPLAELKRLKWKTSELELNRNNIEGSKKDVFSVDLKPKQIRSYLVKLR